MTSPVDADAFFTELSDLFSRLGALHYGEDVSQLEHALQTAHHARVDGAPPALVAAALLHDVGHMMQKAGEDAADRGIVNGDLVDVFNDRGRSRSGCTSRPNAVWPPPRPAMSIGSARPRFRAWPCRAGR